MPCIKNSGGTTGLDAERTITEIEALERMFSLSDPRPPGLGYLPFVNHLHDEKLARNPWFQLWKRYGK
jgi:hypothetical protein